MAISNVAAVLLSGAAPGDPVFLDRASLDLDDSYPAGGYDFSAGTAARILLDAQIGAGKTIFGVLPQTVHAAASTASSILLFTWDAANDKLQAFISTTGAEAAAGDADMSGVTGLELIFLSK